MKQPRFRRWLKAPFVFVSRLSLSEQFLVVSFVILLGGMLIMGWWVANRIENAVINQTADVTALYMKSFVAPLLQPLMTQGTLNDDEHRQLQQLVTSTPLGQEVVAMKVWAPDGTILFSLQPSLIGAHYTLDDDQKEAFGGQVISHISSLSKPEDYLERQFYSTLIETYVPIYAAGTNRVIAVVEFYQFSDPLLEQIGTAQRESWLVVALATMLMYGLLSGIVARGSRTIDRQQTQLQQSVNDLAALLEENRGLHHRLRAAAAREAEINEQFLHRIGRDLHDGPAQDLALALLRIDDVCRASPSQLETIRHALHSALHEIRTLAAGLQLPELEAVPTAEVARRAVREFQRKTGMTVEFEASDSLPALSLSQKIAVYRVIAEALHNSYRHAEGKGLRVKLTNGDQNVTVEITDQGPGFDLATLGSGSDHLGIAGLQQRVALLGGSFDIQSGAGHGTRIYVSLPLKER